MNMGSDRQSDYVNWYAFEDDKTVALWDGSYMTTYSLRGPDMEMRSKEERVAHSERLNAIWKGLGQGWSFHLEGQNTALSSYQTAEFPTEVSRLLDAERKRDCEKEGAQFEMRHFLSLTQAPQAANVLGHLFTSGGGESVRKRQRDRFRRQTSEVFEALKGVVSIDKMSDDRIATYLHSTVSLNRHKVSAADHEVLSESLPDMRFQRRLGLSKLGDYYVSIMTVGGFPLRSNPQLLQSMGKLPYEFRWVTRWVGMDSGAAKALMKQREEKALGSAVFFKDVLINGMDNWSNKGKSKPLRGHIRDRSDREELKHADAAAGAMESLSERGYGHLFTMFMVWDRDADRCREKQREMVAKIQGDGKLVVRVESIEPLKPWLMSLPGNRDIGRRSFPVSTRNLADLMPTTSTFRGAPSDAQLAKTTGVTRPWLQSADPETYRLNSDDKGGAAHTLLFGKTGLAAKSTIANTLALQFLGWPDARIVSFSVGRSELGPCLMSGGVCYSLGDRKSPALQPLAHVDDPDAALDANEWLQLCVECVGEKVTTERRLALEDAVKMLAAEPIERRTMTALTNYLSSRLPGLDDVLRPYTHAGIYGHIFDGNEAHRFEFRRWTMIDLSHIVTMKTEAQAPAIAYMLKRLRKRFDGKPTLVMMDEAPDWLHLPGLEREAIRIIDTERKRNVRLLLVAQTPAQIRTRLPNLLASIKSGATSRIYGADPEAKTQADDYAEFGVTRTVLDRIAALGKQPIGTYIHQAGSRGVRQFKLNAGPIGLALAGSSSTDDLALFEELLERWSDGDAILREFLKNKRLTKEAKELGLCEATVTEMPLAAAAE